MRSGQLQQAREALGQVDKKYVVLPLFRLLDAEIALKTNNNARAMRQARAVLAEIPDQIQASLVLAQALFQDQQVAEARHAFEALVDKYPTNNRVQYGLGLFHLKLQRFDLARQIFENILVQDPQAVEALSYIADSYVAAEQLDQAIQRCQQQLKQVPDQAGMHELLGRLWLQQGRDDQAEKSLKHALSLNPNNARGHYILASLYAQRESYETAKAHFEKVLELVPWQALAANNLAWLYAETGGDLEKAWALAEMAQARLPDNPNVADTKAWIHYKNGNTKLALDILEKSIVTHPQNRLLHYHLGFMQQAVGDTTAAQRSLGYFLELDDEHKYARQARALIARMEAGQQIGQQKAGDASSLPGSGDATFDPFGN